MQAVTDKEAGDAFSSRLALRPITIIVVSHPGMANRDPERHPTGTPGWEEFGETEPGLLLGQEWREAPVVGRRLAAASEVSRCAKGIGRGVEVELLARRGVAPDSTQAHLETTDEQRSNLAPESN